MQQYTIKKGTTSKILMIDIYDSSSTVGARLAGLVYNTASLSAYYNREGAAGAATAITLATATKGTWATGGFIAIDATNMAGHYELHVPDAALATGANSVMVELKGATNMVPKTILIELVDNVEADTYARLGAPAGASIAADLLVIDNFVDDIESRIGTPVGASISADIAGVQADTDDIQARLPAALVTGRMDSSVGSNLDKTGYALTQAFPTNFASLSITAAGLVDITQAAADKAWSTAARTLTSFGTLISDMWANITRTITGGTVTTNSDKTGYSLSAAGIQAIWDALTSALTTVGSIGKLLVDNINATISSRSSHTAADVWSAATRTLTSFGTLVSDVWANATRTLTSFGTLVSDIWANATRTLTTNSGIKKNTALNNFEFFMRLTSDHVTGGTGLTVTATRSIDGAAFAACANAVVEVANGIYRINLAATDLNGDVITLKFTAATADATMVTIITVA